MFRILRTLHPECEKVVTISFQPEPKASLMRFRILGLLLLALVATAPGGAQWPTARPVDVGLDSSAIRALERDLAAGRYGLVDGFALVKNGRLIWSAQWRRNYDSVYRALAPTDTINHQFNYDHPA